MKQRFFRPGLRFSGLLTAAGALACAATVLGFFGAFFWPADLFAHFRAQYLLGLTVLGLLLLWTGRRKTAGIFLLFAAVNSALLLPLYFGRQSVPVQDGSEFRVMLLNVNRTDGM